MMTLKEKVYKSRLKHFPRKKNQSNGISHSKPSLKQVKKESKTPKPLKIPNPTRKMTKNLQNRPVKSKDTVKPGNSHLFTQIMKPKNANRNKIQHPKEQKDMPIWKKFVTAVFLNQQI